ncbi:MAG: hypothetical protein KBS85_04135 [Lachnospiraceae bacterium]|nr:hypothetical protein [Candidatus Merdinaster equi]
MPIAYFKKTNYLGSLSGMRYCIGKHEEGEGEDVVKTLRVTIWPGPFAMDKSDPDTMYHEDFAFSPDGISDAVDYVNDEFEKNKVKWTSIPFWSPEAAKEYNSKYAESLSDTE